MDEELLKAYLPAGFGKQTESFDVEARYELAIRPEYAERLKKVSEDDGGSDSDDSDSDDEVGDLPTTHQVIFRGHSKAVSSISVDSKGFRFATGSYDCGIKLWDFNGMNSMSRNSFRDLEPDETHHVKKASFSTSGQSILALTRSSKPKVYSRDGELIAEYVAGDMYLIDMKNTKGHTAEISSGEWNHTNTHEFVTGGHDSTVRIWDANNPRSQKSVIVLRNAKGAAKNRVSSVNWSHNGSSVLAGTMTGSLSLWDARGSLMRPSESIEDAHVDAVSCILAHPDGYSVATRAGDILNIWDTRRMKTPVMSRSGLVSNSEEANVSWSPDGQSIIAGTATGGEGPGKLEIMDKSDLASIQSLVLDHQASVTTVNWDSTLNQIFCGLSNGSVYLLFSREKSTKGAMTVIEKAPRVRHIDEDSAATTDISVLGLNDEEFKNSRQRDARREQSAARPKSSSAKTVWGTPDATHVASNVELSHLNKEDPREALLRYAEQAKTDPRFSNMPKEPKIFTDPESIDDSENKRKKLKIGK